MRLDVNSARAGQYFTSFHIAEMMARMQFSKEDFEKTVAEKGEVTVCDPTVGSGVMLLAFAKIVAETFGRQALSKLKLYGTDIDERCVLMTRIQLRMNGLDAFGRMAGLLGAMEKSMPADAVMLKSGKQLDLPGVAA
jgi:type I restriction-modification system DNA methylase subunit